MRFAAFILAAVLAASPSAAQAPDPHQPSPAPDAPDKASPGDPEKEDDDSASEGRKSKIRPYGKVVTKDAESDEGVFTVHRIGERVLYEIPTDLLGREFLWVSQIARTTVGAGYGGQGVGNTAVKWERRGEYVLLRSISYDLVASPESPVAKAVAAANYDAILMSFEIKALGEGEAPVIDVSKLFTTDVPEFSGRSAVKGRSFVRSRSFVERAVSFAENIEVEATHTYNNPPSDSRTARNDRVGSSSVLMHFSMVLLPETPMPARAFDERVGYFSVRQIDYGQDDQRAPARRYITRWRLEKKDPDATLSDPIKPIVYYIDPATPAKWVPYLKRGIEAWQPSFEAAGFTSAIIAKDAPSQDDDPDWSPEDARYSVVRWLPSTVQNASGPHVHDPRSGEILESDIQFHHNVMKLVRDWYFIQAGAVDPRARTLPLPDELMGRLLEMVMTHEVGHTLGLQHNMKASSLYPAEKLRDPKWVKSMGHTPSIMDYARLNYVAQPEDGIDVADLVPSIGPYDRWAIGWGYRPIAGAAGPEAEKSTLNQWAREQDGTPWLRFSTPRSRGTDPGQLREAVGDEDAILSTGLGLKNLERVSAMMLAAVSKPGEPYTDLNEMYGRLLGQWALELGHVAALVGSVDSHQRHAGQEGVTFSAVARERQIAAVQFLNERAFHVPAFLVRPDILRRIEPTGALARVGKAQQGVLSSLLSSARVARLVEQQVFDPADSYRPLDYLRDLRKGVWGELYGPQPVQVNAYRRSLQRAYVKLLTDLVSGPLATADDARAFFRGELRRLDADLGLARPRSADVVTRLHIEDVQAQIESAFDPSARVVVAPARPAARAPGLQWELGLDIDSNEEADGCWPDYAIY